MKPSDSRCHHVLIFMNFVQDFEALTPNLLARTVETVEGGGLVVLLLRTMSSLKQLYTMAMVCDMSLSLKFYCTIMHRRSTRPSQVLLTLLKCS